MRHLPFDKPGRFWRGNLHTHSTRSDGKLTPEQVVGRYRAQGYDFIALTDHFLERYGYPIVDTRAWRDDEFTTLVGAELHAPALAHGDLWHILAVGLPFDFAPNRNGEGGPDLAARAAAAGAFVGIAHPGWYSLTLVDALTIEAAHAVEVYNHTAFYDNDRSDGWYISDQFGILGRRHFAYAADDAHFATRPDYFGAWVQVKAESLDPDALLAALKAGQFYSSQGPEIHDVAIVGNAVRVASSPARAIFVGGAGSKSRRVIAEPGAAVSEAEFPLDPFAGSFCRVTVVDAEGRRAWSNPIWLE